MILAKQGDVVESIEGKPRLKNVEQGKVVLVFGEQEKVLEIKSPFPGTTMLVEALVSMVKALSRCWELPAALVFQSLYLWIR